MSKEVVFDYSKATGFISAEEMANFKKTVMAAKETLLSKEGAGNDYLGWIDLPVDYDKDEFARIKKAACLLYTSRLADRRKSVFRHRNFLGQCLQRSDYC